MAGITHGGTLPDSAQKTDFYAIIDNGTVTNIVNADISSTAAIVDTKLAQITTAGKVATSAITDGDVDLAKITGDSLHFEETTAPSTAAGEGAIYTKDSGGQPELFYREESDGDEVQITNGGVVGSGIVLQVVNVMDGAVATGTTVIPYDDTIPQITEGDEYMTLSITPTSATNKLKIEVVCFFSTSGTSISTVALFQDSTANALACVGNIPDGATSPQTIVFTHYMDAGTTSETTFRVRAGNSGAGTTTFNGASSARIYGGVAASSITITEIAV